MNIIDSHCHIFLEEFDEDRAEAIQRAKDVGVSTLILPNVDSTTLSRLKESCALYPSTCKALIGLHPTSVNAEYKNELAIIEQELTLNANEYIGIGEIGIDLYWDKSFYTQQVNAFLIQLKIAKSMNFPVVIHIRNSFDETFEALEKHGESNYKGVFHCFSGNLEQAKRAIDLGFKLGIGGVVTFKNGGLDKVVSEIDMKDIILETDSPYLAPTPLRGKRNEPSFIIKVAQKIAEIKSLDIEEVARITTENCKSLFSI